MFVPSALLERDHFSTYIKPRCLKQPKLSPFSNPEIGRLLSPAEFYGSGGCCFKERESTSSISFLSPPLDNIQLGYHFSSVLFLLFFKCIFRSQKWFEFTNQLGSADVPYRYTTAVYGKMFRLSMFCSLLPSVQEINS